VTDPASPHRFFANSLNEWLTLKNTAARHGMHDAGGAAEEFDSYL